MQNTDTNKILKDREKKYKIDGKHAPRPLGQDAVGSVQEGIDHQHLTAKDVIFNQYAYISYHIKSICIYHIIFNLYAYHSMNVSQQHIITQFEF